MVWSDWGKDLCSCIYFCLCSSVVWTTVAVLLNTTVASGLCEGALVKSPSGAVHSHVIVVSLALFLVCFWGRRIAWSWGLNLQTACAKPGAPLFLLQECTSLDSQEQRCRLHCGETPLKYHCNRAVSNVSRHAEVGKKAVCINTLEWHISSYTILFLVCS